MLEEIIPLIKEAIIELNEELGVKELEKPSEKTRILGASSGFDSLALVRLLVDVEGRIQEKFELDIVLSDERAMSQQRSPFRSVKSLAEYINTLIREKQSE